MSLTVRNGTELWVTDGSAAGTALVKDINPGSGGSDPYGFAALGDGTVLFSAFDGTHGFELWVTDGTAGGTALVEDINFGAAASSPAHLTALVPCFCRGTRIMTEQGEVAIEDLAVGDTVVTLSGEAKPVRWIGRRSYDNRFIANNKAVLPVRIAASAIADGIPARDLFVSPEHALYIDGLFLPARLLINGVTIMQCECADRLEYFHIELASHDVIFAEGATAETFVDFGGRGIFHNCAEFTSVYPDAAPADWEAYKALLDQGTAGLGVIRADLLARAERLGFLDRDPGLHLIVDGNMVAAQAVVARVHRFAVPPSAQQVTIASRSVIPAGVEASSLDLRRLGVPLERIALCGSGLRIEIEHDCAALRDGFHADEGSHRWTDGRGRLPPALLACFASDLSIDVQIGATELHYPADVPTGLDATQAPGSESPPLVAIAG